MIPHSGREKDASRQVAMRMRPDISGDLSRKKDHGRADAFLIAEFYRRQVGLERKFEGR